MLGLGRDSRQVATTMGHLRLGELWVRLAEGGNLPSIFKANVDFPSWTMGYK
jgi:hypothetical protein